MERTDSKHSVCTRHSNGDNSDHSSHGFLWPLWFCEAKYGQVPVLLGLWTIHRRFFLSIIRVSLLLLGSSHHHCHQLDLLLHNWFLFMQTLAPNEKYPVKVNIFTECQKYFMKIFHRLILALVMEWQNSFGLCWSSPLSWASHGLETLFLPGWNLSLGSSTHLPSDFVLISSIYWQ